MEPKFFYRFDPIGIDPSDEKEVRKYGRELHSLSELSERFQMLKTSYERAEKNSADIVINILPAIAGAEELSVFHEIRRKLFSRAIKKNCFSLCLTKYDDHDILWMHSYETTDFSEVERIFSDLINERVLPRLDAWEHIKIG